MIRLLQQKAGQSSCLSVAWIGSLLMLVHAHPLQAQDINDLVQMDRRMRTLHKDGQYREAAREAEKLVELAERLIPANQPNLPTVLNNAAAIFKANGEFAKAEELNKRVIQLRTQILGRNHSHTGQAIHNLAILYQELDRYDEAEQRYIEAMNVFRAAHGESSGEYGRSLNSLGTLAKRRHQYEKAEDYLRKSLRVMEAVYGQAHNEVAMVLDNLSLTLTSQGRLAEAEQLILRAIQIRQSLHGSSHFQIVLPRQALGLIYARQGRTAQAEEQLKTAFDIAQEALGPDHVAAALLMRTMASVYTKQQKYREAEFLLQQSLRINRKAYGQQHSSISGTLRDIAGLRGLMSDGESAERLCREALEIDTANLGSNAIEVADDLKGIALSQLTAGKKLEALSTARKAVSFLTANHPEDQTRRPVLQMLISAMETENADVDAAQDAIDSFRTAASEFKSGRERMMMLWFAQLNQAKLEARRERFDETLRILDSIDSAERSFPLSEKNRHDQRRLRATALWKSGQRETALQLAEESLAEIERWRLDLSGSDWDRAKAFSPQISFYETLASWQHDLNMIPEMFSTIERMKGRELLDLLTTREERGNTPASRQYLDSQAALFERIAAAEYQLEQIDARDGADAERERGRLTGQIEEVRSELSELRRQRALQTPVQRRLLDVDDVSVPVEKLQAQLRSDNAVLLNYLIGVERSFVIAVSGDDLKAYELNVSSSDAAALKIESGKLTSQKLDGLVFGGERRGLHALLSHPDDAESVVGQLAALWNVLIPEDVQTLITSGNVRRLIVIPNGPLETLPFETLVVEPSSEPVYLLDAGPPIQYGASATILNYLASKEETPVFDSLLTVSDPLYPGPADNQQLLAARTISESARFTHSGGTLVRLQHSAQESRWIASLFRKAGLNVTSLTQAAASESGFRRHVKGNSLIHLACHGIVDHDHGNLFGALVLSGASTAPGTRLPEDDAFLRIDEILDIDLSQCRLAILSACQTNTGPQTKGEGAQALSRAFLVAGAHRVVASNWLVDDEAAASLVSYFCGGIANGIARKRRVDVAESLHTAKRWLRSQDKWKSPYYWGTFVMVGPE